MSKLALCLLLAVSLSGCSHLFKKDDGEGRVTFTLDTSDSPLKPNIAVPENTARFLMELINEKGSASDSEEGSSSEESSDSADSSDTAERSGGSVNGEFAVNGEELCLAAARETATETGNEAEETESATESNATSADEESSSDESSVSASEVETTCSIIPASYSISKDYTAGEEVSMTITNVSSGTWIVRVSALDASDNILGHVQKSVTISDGGEVSVSGWLNPGPAPEGYLFMASPSTNSVVRLSLMSEELQTLYTNGHSPAMLFCKGGFEAGKGSLLYALTGAADLLNITADISGTECSVTEQYIPVNNGYVAPGESAVISYFRDNGVRFYNYDDYSYSDLVYTGSGASEFSNVVNGYAWVTNENSRDMTKIDISKRAVAGSNISTGDVVKKLWLNDAGSRLWTICLEPSPCVRVIDSDGKSLDNYTTQIVSPSALRIVGDVVCVGESSRNEVVFFEEADKCREIERLVINEGVGGVFFSDGYRLYVLTNQNSLAAVDLATRSYNRTIKITGDCSSIVWIH
ncbi:MAG: hypothetical protein Q4F00_14135 [bacterium]|nr:hypothetical protein [bacterium]